MNEQASAGKAVGRLVLMMTIKWAIIYGVVKAAQRTAAR